MASISIQTNLSEVTDRLVSKLKKLQDKEYLLRPVVVDLIDLMTKRIHIDGKASDDRQIGTYSPAYMVVRTGKYKNADRFSRGANKGQNKNSGTFSKRGVTRFTQEDEETVSSKRGFVKGNFGARPNYNRTDDTKIIVSLTRQLENDWSVIATKTGYGIGFKNKFNMQKARWVEANKERVIFSLSNSEFNYAKLRLNELVAEALK